MFKGTEENPRLQSKQNFIIMSDVENIGAGKHKSSSTIGDSKDRGPVEPAQKRVALGTLTNVASRSTLPMTKQLEKVV